MSDFIQQSFRGGMNLLADDTRIQSDQYVVGFNLRNRLDTLEPCFSSVEDEAAPAGLKQELITFGNFVILFVAGYAYYRYFSDTGWQQISGFKMSSTAPRFWTQEVPVALTNYLRMAVQTDGTTNPRGGIIFNNISSATQGNFPGLLVQDNINQPLFIFLNSLGYPEVRITQTYDQWDMTVVDGVDKREYVPIGNTMAWVDDKLYIASQDGTYILHSVSGRPLDFVINVKEDGDKGGDAYTTAYSVGVGGISCLREMSNAGLFVAASNANFNVTKDKSNIAPTLFGEFTFIRTFLFNATCLSDRVILDSLGDTRFISLTGVRSFNAILQQENEGRNSLFTLNLQNAFVEKVAGKLVTIVQSPTATAAILYDNYEFYAVQTVFGPAIAVYDTLNQCWSSFDLLQTGRKLIKIFAKIELSIQRLYGVTEDDKLFELYAGPNVDTPSFRPVSATSSMVSGGDNPIKGEIKLNEVRCVLNKVTEEATVTAIPYSNNMVADSLQTKTVFETEVILTGATDLSDIGTKLANLLFSFPNCRQGWKTFCKLSWSSGALVQFSYSFTDLTPMNPLLSQSSAK